jgi:hypothetical protein
LQPIRQQAHGVAADHQAEKAMDPNDDPASFNEAPDLPRIHAVPYQLENTLRIPGSLAADDTKHRTKIIQRRSIVAACAELLDTNSECYVE